MGFHCKRYNLKAHPPKMTWVSMPCTRLSALQNLTPRTEEEWAKFERRRGQDLKRADEAETIEETLDARKDADFAWEWPTTAKRGWDSRAIRRLLNKMRQLNRPVFCVAFTDVHMGLSISRFPFSRAGQCSPPIERCG